MLTTFEHLSLEQKKQLSYLVEKIVKLVEIDKIICYSFQSKTQHNWSCIPLSQTKQISSTIIVNLLITIPQEDKRYSYEAIQLAENFNTNNLLLTCIAHSSTFVKTAISQGDLFFRDIYLNGDMLYGSPWNNLSVAPAGIDLKNRLSLAATSWKSSFSKAQNILKGANFYLANNIPDQAVFSLHHAIEQTAIALMHSLSGYYPNSHDLSRLFSLLQQIGFNANSLFPQNTEQEKLLFDDLKKSRSDSRCRDNKHISSEVAQILYYRTASFMMQAEALYNHELEKWQEQIKNNPPASLIVAFRNPLHNAS